jgi:predicted ArsR family transcriptional regulator
VDRLAHLSDVDSTTAVDRAEVATSAAPAGLTDAEFSAAVVAVSSAFGDPTRRQIYLFARERIAGVTAGEVADHFALHANVARHHLDKLAAGGYLDVFLAREAHGGAGRPSKRYRLSGPAAGLELPLKGDDLLITLLGKALSLLPTAEAEAMAEEVGEEYGRRLAAQMSTGEGQRSFRAALHAVAAALTAHGFAAHAEARGGSLLLIKESCPFFDTAREHPVICAVDRGMVRGMLAGLYGSAVPVTESSRAMGDEACVTAVPVTESPRAMGDEACVTAV